MSHILDTRLLPYAEEHIEQALRVARGFHTKAAKMLGVSLNTFKKYFEYYPNLYDIEKEIIESNLDYVEDNLLRNIGNGNVIAQIFYLKCKGKNRGFVERQEISGPNGSPLTITVVPATADIVDAQYHAIPVEAPKAIEHREEDPVMTSVRKRLHKEPEMVENGR